MSPGRISFRGWDASHWIKVRLLVVCGLIAIGFCLVIGRAFFLQVLEQEKLGGLARDQYLRTVELSPRRGEILDRHGATLASSLEVESIFVDPHLLSADPVERRERALQIARIAGLSSEKSRKFLERASSEGNRFAWVRRKASPAIVAKIKALGFEGVGFVKESRRFYPQRELAAQVLGFVGSDGHGLEGLERGLDEELRGQAASIESLRDAHGRKVLPDVSVPVEERTGNSVELTLDRTIQYLAEKALAKTVEKSKAASGTAVVLDPRTGEILALAQAPTFNPNVVPGRNERGHVRNRVVSDAFEPGSTMKVFLLAGALENGAIKPNQTFDGEKGRWKVGRHTIHDHHPYGLLTPGDILRVSSNICSGKVALSLGGDKLAQIYQDFGFGQRTGIELPAETPGLVAKMKSDISVVTGSFGQGPVMASPLQIALGLASIANGGELLQPWIVKTVTSPDGQVIRRGEKHVVRRVVSDRTAAQLNEWMRSVVSDDGTAELAAVDGYPVAGKTGTAQKVDPSTRSYGRARIASFGGFVPADDPQLVILVVIDEPQGQVYGGLVAAPAFKEIAEGSLKSLGIPPTQPLTAKVEKKPEPKPTKKIEEEAAEGFVADDGAPPVEGPDQVRVPDLRGLFARAAIRSLSDSTLEADLDGSGRVVKQEPPAGSIVERGARVAVTLQPL